MRDGGEHATVPTAARSPGIFLSGCLRLQRYDPAVLSYSALIDWFFQNHSWRSNNVDYRQYMNGCWSHDDEQAAVLHAAVSQLPGEVQTFISARTPFYRAEEYHQKFYAKQSFGGSSAEMSCGAGTQALF